MFSYITASIDLQGTAGEKTLLCIVLGRQWGHSPGKETRHLPRGEVCCMHVAFVVPVNTQRGNWTQEGKLSR